MRFPSSRAFGFATLLSFGVCAVSAGATVTVPSDVAHAAGLPSGTVRVPNTNGRGMDMHLFRPAVDSKGFFSVNGADILGHKDFNLGLVLDYGHGLGDLNKPEKGYLLDHALQGTFQVNVGLFNHVTLGLTAPIILNKGDAIGELGEGGNKNYQTDDLSAQGMGYVAMHVKGRILRPDGDTPLGIAMIGQVGYGFGSPRDFGTEPGFFYWPQLVLEKRIGGEERLRLALNAGYRGQIADKPVFGKRRDGSDQLRYGKYEHSDFVTGSFGISYRVLQPLDVLAETYVGYQPFGDSDDRQRVSAEALAGLKIFVEKRSFLTLAGGLGYTPGLHAADQRAVIGFVFEPSIGDRDGDGIKDDEDDCPDNPEDYDSFQDTRGDSPPNRYGCPDPDNDNDGILDKQDRCPSVPEDRDGDSDGDGCPEGSDGDRDGDGILDSRDKCPDQPEDRDGFDDRDGCPDWDNDNDGLKDTVDQCPDDPEDIDQWQDDNGCPDPDNDLDSILDPRDRCPNDPETFNGFEDEEGCPDKGQVMIVDNDIIILDKILFKTASAEILPESFAIVKMVATTMEHHPEFTLVEVQGHADERSSDEYNLKLTQDRARSVVEALIQEGVAPSRVRAMGYGEYCPLDPRHTGVAWEKNRRVEFKVVRSDKGPTGVKLGCPKAREMGVNSPAD